MKFLKIKKNADTIFNFVKKCKKKIFNFFKKYSNKLINYLKKEFFCKPDKYEKETFFYDLCPIDNVEDVQLYYNRFMTSIEKGNKSIAFTGQYGVGKTSVINSILTKLRGNFKTIRISLGTLSNKKNTTTEELEMKILQQIIYTVNELRLPKSRFKRIRFLDFSNYAIFLLITSVIFLIITVYCPNLFVVMLEPIYSFLSGISCYWIAFIFCYIFYIAFAFLFAYILFFIKLNLNVTFFKYKDLEIKVSPDDHSIFNKYLDEIVYFFQTTKVKLVIIEDLDRYGNISLNVFKQLKELNYVLNKNETIIKNGGLIFLYSVRDDLFFDSENRVKFFDYIIPIVSKFSSNNIKTHILKLYDDFKNTMINQLKLNDVIDVTIDDNLFTILSLYIRDRRLLYNIFMEYKTYIDAFVLNKNINFTQLFALISYKNSNPVDFDLRLKANGDLFNAFDLKETFIYLINKDVRKKIEIYEEKLERIASNRIKDIDDLKKLFIYNNIDPHAFIYDFDNIYLVFGDEKVNLNDFFDKKFIIDKLKNKKILLKYPSGSSNVDDKITDNFLEKVNSLDYGTIFINERIKFYQKQISENEELSLCEIFNIDNIENILSHDDAGIQKKINSILSNRLLVSLIRNAFIKENYENDLSYFMGSNHDDYNFIVSVDNGDKSKYDYKINDIEYVISRIEVSDFKKESILNFYICNYILTSTIGNKKKLFFEQFKNVNDYKIKFLDRYCNFDYNNFIILLKNIFNNDILSYFINSDIIINRKEWLCAILENIPLKINNNNKIALKKYLESDTNLINSLKFNKICISNICLLDLSYEDYSMFNLNVIKELYNAGQFVSNYNFYTRLVELYNIPEEIYKINDVLYNNKQLNRFYVELINSDVNKFYEYFDFFESKPDSIINFLNDKIDNNLKIKVLKKEKNIIDNIIDINEKELWNEILKNKKCVWNLKNLLDYFQYKNEYDELIMDMLCEISHDYHFIEHDILEVFEKNLLYIKYNSEIDYSNISKNFTYIYVDIDLSKNVNFKFLDELIKYAKVECNVAVFNRLTLDHESYLWRIAEKQMEKFISIVKTVYVSHNVIEEVLRSKIDIDMMIKLLEVIDLKNISINVINLCVYDIVNSGKQYNLSDSLINGLFAILEINERVNLFIYLYDNDAKYISYFYKVYRFLNIVRDGSASVASFHYNESLVRLFECLLKNGQINSLNVTDKKIKISFPKTKLF